MTLPKTLQAQAADRDRTPATRDIGCRHERAARWAYAYAALFFCLLTAPALPAATFSSVSYNSTSNELVVTLNYGGTNPNHQFSVQWGTCRALGSQGNHQIVAVLLDNQWDDAAQQQFTTTVHVSLADLNCRPAAVTLRSAPKYEYTIQIQ
jgi:hypothetical protein